MKPYFAITMYRLVLPRLTSPAARTQPLSSLFGCLQLAFAAACLLSHLQALWQHHRRPTDRPLSICRSSGCRECRLWLWL